MSVTKEMLTDFLRCVDRDFPKPLSEWMSVEDYADKLFSHADLCTRVSDDGVIIGLAAGYTENLVGDMAFVACVAVKRSHRGEGIATALVKEFFEICKSKDIPAVHVYTEADNFGAQKMYRSLGFREYTPENEPRPDDVHFIKYFVGD